MMGNLQAKLLSICFTVAPRCFISWKNFLNIFYSDIDECSKPYLNQCDHDCKNTYGSYFCTCKEGYEIKLGSKGKCVDINECQRKLSSCSYFCRNKLGSYTCSCPTGFILQDDQYTCSGKTLN